MQSMIKTGIACLSAFALLSAMPLATQAASTAPAAGQNTSQEPGQESGPDSGMSDQDIMNVALVCVATYDLTLSTTDARQIEAVKTARELARSIYKETSQQDDAAVDAEISKIDAALADEVAGGGANLTEFRKTCDSLLMEDETPDTVS